MKTLLFSLLLCAGLAQGQTDTASLWFTLTELDMNYYTGNGKHKAESITPITIELLLQYAEECHNDSTVQYSHFNHRNNCACTAEWYILTNPHQLPKYTFHEKDNPLHYTRKVTHRIPTFEGFIVWLKNK